MDKNSIAKLKKDLLKKKSHDIFKNVQAIFDLAYSTNDMELNFKCREICVEKSKKLAKKSEWNLMKIRFTHIKGGK